MGDGTMSLYSRDEIAIRFLDAQRADFSMTQVQRMITQADRDGQSKDFGDGYNIYRIGNLYRATVAGREI